LVVLQKFFVTIRDHAIHYLLATKLPSALSLRSRHKRKAWGASPRNAKQNPFPARDSGRQRCRPLSRARRLFYQHICGLLPTLYACACFAGYENSAVPVLLFNVSGNETGSANMPRTSSALMFSHKVDSALNAGPTSTRT